MNQHQQSPTYCIELKVQFQYLQEFVDLCDLFSDTVVYFEAEDTKTIDSRPEDLWQINIYFEEKPNLSYINQKMSYLAMHLEIACPTFSYSCLEDRDWVAESQKYFAPINAGKFFIHDSNYQNTALKNLITIEINAGRAFGTGEHETTRGCLIALSELSGAKTVLDIGCGSGILAIAMAKLGIERVIAVDIDEQAVLVTEENAKINNVDNIIAKQSDGYNSTLIKENAPYQIITANILAKPLIAMAKSAAQHLDSNGILILAGFIKEQMDEVLAAHLAEDLKLVKTICFNNWPILIMSNGK